MNKLKHGVIALGFLGLGLGFMILALAPFGKPPMSLHNFGNSLHSAVVLVISSFFLILEAKFPDLNIREFRAVGGYYKIAMSSCLLVLFFTVIKYLSLVFGDTYISFDDEYLTLFPTYPRMIYFKVDESTFRIAGQIASGFGLAKPLAFIWFIMVILNISKMTSVILSLPKGFRFYRRIYSRTIFKTDDVLRREVSKRASRLKLRAFSSLILVFIVLCSGGVFIFYAGQIIEVETKSAGRYEEVSQLIGSFKQQQTAADTQLDKAIRHQESVESARKGLEALALPSMEELLASIESKDDVNLNFNRIVHLMYSQCQLSLEATKHVQTIANLCIGEKSRGLIEERKEQYADIESLKQMLANAVHEVEMEMTGADGRIPGLGPAYKAAREEVDRIEFEIEELERRIETSLQAVTFEDLRSKSEWELYVDKKMKSSPLQLFMTIHQIQRDLGLYWESLVDVAEDKVNYAEKIRDSLSIRVDELQKYVTTHPDKFLTPETVQGPGWPTLLTILFTRLSVLLIVVFLVQILVSLYRYSLRLAAFYDSASDALRMGGDSHAKVKAWSNTLTPKNIDFGKPPVSPSQHLENIASGAKSLVPNQD